MIGANRCGRALMRLMQGADRPSPSSSLGDPELCKVNYVYQNQAEGLDANKGVLETLVEAAPDEQLNDLKALLGQMEVQPRSSFHKKPVKFLSGGEKARLPSPSSVTPANVAHGRAHEPPGHPEHRAAGGRPSPTSGSLIAISHDRYFLRQSCVDPRGS